MSTPDKEMTARPRCSNETLRSRSALSSSWIASECRKLGSDLPETECRKLGSDLPERAEWAATAAAAHSFRRRTLCC
jgi:hypothetical protein